MEEAQSWSLFIQKNGPLNDATRLEQGFAMLAFVVSQGLGLKKQGGAEFSINDFLPRGKVDEKPASPEDIARLFGIDVDG